MRDRFCPHPPELYAWRLGPANQPTSKRPLNLHPYGNNALRLCWLLVRVLCVGCWLVRVWLVRVFGWLGFGCWLLVCFVGD